MLEKSTYDSFLLEPIPVGNKVLKLPAKAAMQNRNKTHFITSECQRIEKNSLCSLDNLKDITGDACYSQLLRESTGNCTFATCVNPSEIKLITDNHIIVKQMNNTEIQSNCGLTKRNLTGTYLIEFHNCTVYINGSKFENIEIIKSEPPFIIPLDGLEIQEQHFEPQIKLEELHIANRKEIVNLANKYQVQTYTSLSMSSCSILLGIAIAWLWIRKKQIKVKIQNENAPPSNIEIPTLVPKAET